MIKYKYKSRLVLRTGKAYPIAVRSVTQGDFHYGNIQFEYKVSQNLTAACHVKSLRSHSIAVAKRCLLVNM